MIRMISIGVIAITSACDVMSVIIFPPCVHKNERSHSPPVCTRTGYVMILLIYLISIHTTRWIRVEGIQIPINGVKRYVCSTIDITRREIPCTYVHEKKEPSSSCSSSFNRHVPEHHPEIHLLSDDLAPKILLFLDVRVIIDNDRSSFLCLALVAIANHTLTSHTTRPMRSYSHMASRNLQSMCHETYCSNWADDVVYSIGCCNPHANLQLSDTLTKSSHMMSYVGIHHSRHEICWGTNCYAHTRLCWVNYFNLHNCPRK